MKKIVVLILSMINPPVFAADVDGVSIPDSVKVSGKSLVLNGAGMRSKFFVDVYVGALYTPKKTGSAEEVLSADVSKRLLMHFVYSEVEREKIVEGWNDGFKANNSAAELKGLKQEIAAFNAMFRTMKSGEKIALDYVPSKGTTVSVNGKVAGVVKGAEFNRALMKIWLGSKPVTADLKDALLGD